MLRTLFSTLFIALTTVSTAQILNSACNFNEYNTTIQLTSALFLWQTENCPPNQPLAQGVVPFPSGTTTTLDGWMRLQLGDAATLGPLASQPELYVACGKDNDGFSTTDFIIQNTGALTFGGLHVGTINNGSFGKNLEIHCTDSLLLKELWVVEGATVDIYGPVYITEECHNAGVINIKEGGSLSFIVDREKHQHALFENRGTFNGRIKYETLYLSRPLLAPFGAFVDVLPSSVLDTISPLALDFTYDEWLQYFSDNYLTFDDVWLGDLAGQVMYTGYWLTGLPLQGVRLNPFDGDVYQKERYKGFLNNRGGFYWATGEDLANSAGAVEDGGYTLISMVNGDTIFFDTNNPEWTLDTSLYQNGVFQNIATLFDPEVEDQDIELFDAASNLSWVPFGDDMQYNGFYPNSFATTLAWFDLRAFNSEGNAAWLSNEHSFIPDSTGLNPFNIHTGGLYTPIEEIDSVLNSNFADLYPPGWRQPQPDYDTQRYKYAGFYTPDSNAPIHLPIGIWLAFAGSQQTPIIWEYEGYPWFNSSSANVGAEYNAYPELPYESQNLTVYDNGIDNEVSIYIPTAPSLTYFYNTAGDLFDLSEFQDCLVENDSLYCYANTQTYELTNLGEFLPITYNETPSGSLVEVQAAHDYSIGNQWMLVSNPTNGYLSLDAVADRYFDEHPDANHLEFAWYNPSQSPGLQWDDNPQAAGVTVGSVKRFWRRKYHRYGNTVYGSELDFWIQLVIDYAAANPFLQNDLVQVFISDYEDDGVINGNTALNYLNSDTLNPWSYYELGKYYLPGGAFWIKNSTTSGNFVNIGPDEAIYDFDFPETVSGYEVAGDTWQNALRQQNDSADVSVVLTVDFNSDSAFYPRVFFHHEWRLDSENGVQDAEDDPALSTGYPFLYSDSSTFLPTSYLYEEVPHNADPLYAIIPEPDSSFMITPVQFQETYTTSPSELPYQKLGIRVNQAADTVTYRNDDVIIFTDSVGPIKYLAEGDSMWFRLRDYSYPLTVELFFTNLRGDVDGDGLVDIQDVLDFNAHYGNCETDVPVDPYIQDYDLNGDGCVTIIDYTIMIAYLEHTLDANGSFNPVQFQEVIYTPQQVIDTHPLDIRTYPGVTIGSNQEVRLAGYKLYLYDTQFERIASARNEVTAPLQDVYIVIAEQPGSPSIMGHIDFRLP